MEGKTLAHTLELAAMVHTIAEVPDFKETPSKTGQVRAQQLESPSIPYKYERHLLTPTASPIRQQVIALSAATLWPHRSAHTLMLTAMVSKAAVVNG